MHIYQDEAVCRQSPGGLCNCPRWANSAFTCSNEAQVANRGHIRLGFQTLDLSVQGESGQGMVGV